MVRMTVTSVLCSIRNISYLLFSRLIMTQKSPSKLVLLHSIENNRTACQKTKNSTINITHPTQNIGINTDHIEFNRNIGTNTPYYAEQMAKALGNGNAAEEIIQMLMQSME